ncbi:mechanosensitive ion channel family protein [Desulfovibrio gilichinskyi]|uniref:Small-conductance mechanosensitive channel n=1 Tax=Desulfovibrio gilichinskyi TaxID=1519643 RepID=A0A1X7DFZ4_9BACT|nr:mechanosensitive ion channel domain-containing protein [Desulfovibrio gilichinskyi]SMF14570.1 Small-conductance mechanosensitive channel [Desulfovibrio gilichinskyi]
MCIRLNLFVIILVSVLSMFSVPDVMGGSLSSSLSGRRAAATKSPNVKINYRDSVLAEEIEDKRLQVEMFEKTFKMDFKHLVHDLADYRKSPQMLERSYRQLLVLMNISIANPYEERMIYNQLFQFESDLDGLVRHYEKQALTITSDISLLSHSESELMLLSAKGASQELIITAYKFGDKLNALIELRKINLRLVQERLDSLLMLQTEVSGTLSELEKDVPELLMAYLLHLRVSLFSGPVMERLTFAPSYWIMGQPAQSFAKMPEDFEDVYYSTLIPLALWLLVYVGGRRAREQMVTSYFSTHPTAKRVLMQIWMLAPLSVGLLIGAQFIDFPSRLLPLQLGLIFAFWVAMKAAWCLRTIRMGTMPATPLYPLFWVFVLGTLGQFLHVPLVMMAVIWPVVLLGVAVTLWKFSKRPYPPLERNLGKVSLYLSVMVCLICLEGHVYFAILFSMWWFLFAVCLQLGMAVAILLKEKSEDFFCKENERSKGLLLSLSIPVVWIILLLALLIWTVSQFGEISLLYKIAGNPHTLSAAVVLLVMILTLRFLTAFEIAHSTYAGVGGRPLKGFLQVSRFVVFCLGVGLTVCFAMDRSPWALLGGVGAVAAALFLLFKDTILALVAGVRIVLDDLVRLGDWIEIDDMGVDGNVIDVSLHCIKIQNFDRTIVTIPTITLTKRSFKNWRGMSESGGRRIKRSIPLDLSSIFFLDEQWRESLGEIRLLKDWFTKKEARRDAFKAEAASIGTGILDSESITNLAAFRGYIEAWLSAHEDVHKGLTFIVRHLDPGAQTGLPLEIYIFANDTDWVRYEAIQADLFDHLLAAVPVFGLRVYQRNALHDGRLAKENFMR